MKARGFTSVMASRRSAPKSLNFFPTPPWATRAGIEIICDLDLEAAERRVCAAEPACGEGHMAHVLADHFGDVAASDVFDYGWGHDVADFLSPGWDGPYRDWIITNPPFSIGTQFATLALERAKRGVALLLRSAFSEGADRYRTIFGPHPPAVEAQFCERVPMVEGRWNPQASSATAYSWFIWLKDRHGDRRTERRWIVPGTRERLWLADDVRRFTAVAPAPLFDGDRP